MAFDTSQQAPACRKRCEPGNRLQFGAHLRGALSTPIAVIGAGVSGLIAARTLQEHGFEATVFEKSRGLGGRVATRRSELGLSFDHGAQYFTVHDPHFARGITAPARDAKGTDNSSDHTARPTKKA